MAARRFALIGHVHTVSGDITEGAIIDGTLLARVADDETISGDWTFTGANSFSGVTTFTGNIVAGTIDADFDAITGTSYGGILEANLVDKSAVETISAEWDFTTNPKIDAAGIDTGTFAADRVATHTGDVTGQTDLSLVVAAITSQTALTSGLGDTDEFLISDAGIIKRMDASVLATYIGAVTSEVNDLSAAVTWANIPDANVPASAVSQHAGAGNLLDKSATETISGSYTFSSVNGIDLLSGAEITTLRRDSNEMFFENANSAHDFQFKTGGTIRFSIVGATSVDVRGVPFRIFDSGITDKATFDHDGTDFNTAFVNTLDWNLTGLTNFKTGAAITATSYGGITEANLLDKSAAETITGSYKISTGAATPLELETSSNGPWAFKLIRTDIPSTIECFNNNEVWYFNPALHVAGALTATTYGGINEANLLDKAAAELISGDWNWQDNDIIRPVLKDYALTNHAETSASNTLTIDMSLGNSVTHTFTEDVSTVTISNPPATGSFGEVWIKFTQHASAAKTITWASKFHFPGGTDHIMSTGLGAVDLVHCVTIDGGTTYFCTFVQALA